MFRSPKELLRRMKRRPRWLAVSPLPGAIIRNQDLKRVYENFLKSKEEAEPTMLHREDLYESGPPIAAPSPPFLELATRHAGRRVLDVGCGIGVYCRELQQRGFDCVGIEWNKEYVSEATKYVHALHMSVEDLKFEDKSFDIQ